jgi:hypothetical protein
MQQHRSWSQAFRCVAGVAVLRGLVCGSAQGLGGWVFGSSSGAAGGVVSNEGSWGCRG